MQRELTRQNIEQVEKHIKQLWQFAFAAFLFAILLSGCAKVPIKDTTKCIIAGVWRSGMDCSTTLSSRTSEMNFEEMIEWLEPQPERPDPAHPGKMLPARAGAFCESSDDQLAEKIALEQACSLLKNACTPEIKAAIATAATNVNSLEKKSRLNVATPKLAPLRDFSLPVPPEPMEDPSRLDEPLEADFQI